MTEKIAVRRGEGTLPERIEMNKQKLIKLVESGRDRGVKYCLNCYSLRVIATMHPRKFKCKCCGHIVVAQ